jgi:hypothetical protein
VRFRIVLNDLQFSILAREFIQQENSDLQKIINNLRIVLLSKHPKKTIGDVETSLEISNVKNTQEVKALFIRFCSEIEFADEKTINEKSYINFFTNDISQTPELNNINNLAAFSRSSFSLIHSVKTYEKSTESWNTSEFIVNKTDCHEVLIYDKYFRQNIERSIQFTSTLSDFLSENKCDIIVFSGQHDRFLDRRSEYLNFQDSELIKKYNNDNQRISIIIQQRLSQFGNHDRIMICGNILIKSGPGFDAYNNSKSGFIDFYNLYYKEYASVFLNSFKEVVKTIDSDEFHDNLQVKDLLMKYRKTLNIH